MGKPSQPVSLDTSILDQAGRYGLSIDDYLYGSTNTYTEGDELPSNIQKGNPFFTGTNQPVLAKTKSVGTQRPFIWQGNNKSLRKVYQDGYNAYWGNHAKPVNTEQQETWKGPQIRPEYQAQSNGLSQLGTPGYWQDNNKNQIFDAAFDDSISAPPEESMGMEQVDALTTSPSSPASTGSSEYDIDGLLNEYAAQALRRSGLSFS